MNYFDLFWKSELPEATLGDARIEKFTVSSEEAAFTAIRREYVASGEYTKLIVGGKLVMSDTRREYNEHSNLFSKAHGTILVNGLGLGCCLNVLLHLPRVDEITVIEINKNVIELVSPAFSDPRLTIIHADAFEYRSPKNKRFNVVWHDIWPDKCLDYLSEMTKLHRVYGKRCDWQESWSRQELKLIKKRQKHYYGAW